MTEQAGRLQEEAGGGLLAGKAAGKEAWRPEPAVRGNAAASLSRGEGRWGQGQPPRPEEQAEQTLRWAPVLAPTAALQPQRLVPEE